MMKKKSPFPFLAAIVLALLTTFAAAADTVYTDPKTDLTFTLPSGWEQRTLSEDSQKNYIEFKSDNFSSISIFYQSIDLWSQMSELQKSSIPRHEYDNSLFTKEDVLALFKLSSADVTEVTYNGYTYYLFEIVATPDAYEVPFSFTMTHLFRVENGWGYLFQINATSEDDCYRDLEALLNSAAYPEVKPDFSIRPGRLMILIMDLIITVVAYLMVPVIFCIKKARLSRKTIRKIVIINGLCVWLLFQIVTYLLSGSLSGDFAVLLWSGVGALIMNRFCAIETQANRLSRIVKCKSCGYQSRDYFENCPQCGCAAKEYIHPSELTDREAPVDKTAEDNDAPPPSAE